VPKGRTFWTVSGLMLNGTLIVGGLLVTAIAVHLANDMLGVAGQRDDPA